MKAAVFCPGPSLVEGDFDDLDLDQFDVTIGVNAGAQYKPCDWFVYADKHTPTKYPPMVSPKGVFSHTGQADLSALLFNGTQFMRWSEGSERVEWFHYSGQAAIGLAVHLGATDIHVYGADMKGGDKAANRHEKRWVNERICYTKYVDYLSDQGITVTRHARTTDWTCPYCMR